MIRIIEAAEYIKSIVKVVPQTVIILGSGLNNLAETFDNKIIIDYKDIPHFPISTVHGHKGRFIYGTIEDKPILAMQGRFHYYEGNKMEDVVLPIRVFAKMGVKNLVVTNAAGGVNKAFNEGCLMIINDHINMLGTNPLIGKNFDELGTRFPDMSNAYCKEYIELAKNVASRFDISLQEGVYCAMTGPSYETPAEIRMLRVLGADAVGMSTVPEVIVANHVGLKILGISCITNMAAGVLDKPLYHEEVIETSKRVAKNFEILVRNILVEL